jgi:hypothetical protein
VGAMDEIYLDMDEIYLDYPKILGSQKYFHVYFF